MGSIFGCVWSVCISAMVLLGTMFHPSTGLLGKVCIFVDAPFNHSAGILNPSAGIRAIGESSSIADQASNETSNPSIPSHWPSWDQWIRVFSLRDYNTRVVIFSATLLGCAAGIVGSFTLLRRRALMGDAISHATLPGICLAYIVSVLYGIGSKSLPFLLFGGLVTGLLGVCFILLIRNLTRLKEDAALGAVLSVFFGAGVALLTTIQHFKQGNAAGLESFIYGKTASMTFDDAMLIAGSAAISIAICIVFFREFKLLCFDEQFARSQGYPVLFLDLMLMSVVVTVTIVGLQAVGLILVIALLVIPAAAARFWTENMVRMVIAAGILGAVSGTFGAGVSAVFPRLPSGAMIVLVCAGFFAFSLLFGTRNGVVVVWLRRLDLNRSIKREHLLRAMYEILESRLGLEALADQDDAEELAEHVGVADLLPKRSWSRQSLKNEMHRAANSGWLVLEESGARFTQKGFDEAERLTRRHRLWEIYLITHADVATSRVDRDADAIEHVLEPETIAELEALLEKQFPQFPASPHSLEQGPLANAAVSAIGGEHAS
jgi:manganese/zinc/iron transport system permease protein